MPILDPNRIYDGFHSLEAGVDGGRRPNLIDPNQCAEAENVIFRGGAPATRLPLTGIGLTFDNPNLTYQTNGSFGADPGAGPQSVSNFDFANLQTACYYSPSRGKEFIMASIGGRLYQITPGVTTATIREIKLLQRNRSTIPIAYMVQADAYLIVQDGESDPIIFDGVTARRAVQNEIFVGTIMAYGMNRIVLKGPAGQIYFGDIYDGKGNGGADVLGFTETQYLNEGFPSSIPSIMGEPTAIAFIPQQDTSTGVGECLVFGESGAESFDLSIDRTLWKDSQFQRTALLGVGNLGHRNVAIINEDLWFRAADGWRSYRQARAQVNAWGQIPMSTNVRKWTDNDTGALLEYGSAIGFDNRLICTCSPQPNQGMLYHNGLLSLDFDVLSTFGTISDPAWDGHWQDSTANPLIGLRVSQVVQGKFGGRHRAFAFVQGSGVNMLLEINREAAGQDGSGPITSEIQTRSMDFTLGSLMAANGMRQSQSSPENEKLLYGGDVWLDGVTDPVAVTTSYRPDQTSVYQSWGSFTGAQNGALQAITGGGVPTATAGYVPRASLQKPDDTADAVTNRLWRRGYEFQVKLRWTGRATVRRFRVQAQQEVENSKATV